VFAPTTVCIVHSLKVHYHSALYIMQIKREDCSSITLFEVRRIFAVCSVLENLYFATTALYIAKHSTIMFPRKIIQIKHVYCSFVALFKS